MLKWFRRPRAATPEPASDAPTDPVADAAESVSTAPAAADDGASAEPAETAPRSAPPSPEPTSEPAPRGLFARLRERLGKTKATLVDKVRAALRLHGKLDEDLLEEIEAILLQSDVGVATTHKIVEAIRRQARRSGELGADAVLALFKQQIEGILSAQQRPLDLDRARPTIVLVVGVNGTGKTTTIGKIARQWADRGRRVMMVAADTFRAAAIEQLTIWAERTGSCIVRQDQGADPAAVVFEALEGAKADPPDLILIDTAGRLHTKAPLMEELRKIVRVIRRHYPDAPHETLLVLDATTGQNALNQIKLFHEACELTGVIMSKLDGTAKGGILIAVKDLYPLPVYKIGIGEGVDDLRDFDPHEFVEALFAGPEDAAARTAEARR